MLPALSLLATLGCGDPDDADTDMIDGVPSSTGPTPGVSTVAPSDTVSPVTPGTMPSSVEPVAPAPGGACPAVDADGIAALTANESHNYAFNSALNFNLSYVKSDTNLTFDWGGLTTDFQNHSLDPLTDINLVLLLVWKMSPEELAEKMNADVLAQSDTAGFAMFYPENYTSAELLEAQVFENPLTPEEIMPSFDASLLDPALYTYTAMARTGTETEGLGTRMIKAFKLDPNSTETTVNIEDDSTTLTWEADLTSLTPTYVPPGTGAISIDWGDMTTTALGTEFKPTKISEVLIAHYTQTPAELEASFLDLEQLAVNDWRGTVEFGTAITLGDLTDSTGAPFTGIDGTGTWLIGLICGQCSNPAPWYLSPLQACTP